MMPTASTPPPVRPARPSPGAGEPPAPASFREQVERAAPRGFVAALALLGSAEEARDAGQEAAARALRARASYDPAQPFAAWYYQIVRNLCLDRLRRRAQAPRAGLETERVPDGAAAWSGAPAEPPEAAFARSERERLLARALTALEPDLRELIHLRHFQELSYAEMAAALDCPVGTVMSRLYRARRALHDAYVRLGGDAPSGQGA